MVEQRPFKALAVGSSPTQPKPFKSLEIGHLLSERLTSEPFLNLRFPFKVRQNPSYLRSIRQADYVEKVTK